jgi:hypothetical protein
MRILFAIAHYFDPRGDGRHGSLSAQAQPRIQALSACLASLHQTFGRQQQMLNIARRVAEPANQAAGHDLEVVICTTRQRHLLADLLVPAHLYRHHPTEAQPELLGFECQAVLRDRLGLFDYFCYLEDDILVRDPLFFVKLAWFRRQTGPEFLLQPNRYELAPRGPCHKLYVDGDLLPRVIAPYCQISGWSDLNGSVMGVPVRFVPARNPHAGCYFLNAEQMAHWSRQPHFLDRDTSFVGPLESAATLGILKTFKIYKPARENASFLEVQHYGNRFLSLLQRAVPVVSEVTPSDAAP